MDKQMNYLIRTYTYIFHIQFCFSNSLWKLLFFFSLSFMWDKRITNSACIFEFWANLKVFNFEISNFGGLKYVTITMFWSVGIIILTTSWQINFYIDVWGSFYRSVVPES